MQITLDPYDLDCQLSIFWILLTCLAICTMFFDGLRVLTFHGKLLDGMRYKFSVPKHWFYHFYLFGLVFVILLRSLTSLSVQLFTCHLLRRLVEQKYLFPGSTESRMHAMAYIFGFVYYLAAILTIPEQVLSPSLFLISNLFQFLIHRALYLNRTEKPKLPKSWFFKYMNCPHYFMEMCIYVSLSSDVSSLGLSTFVVVSLGLNWHNQSVWYSEKSA